MGRILQFQWRKEERMRFRRRDHESFIGGYDPEREMPDPGRDPRERWQSDAYRANSREGRYPYRWSPGRFEERRSEDYARGFDHGYERGLRDHARYGRDYSRDARGDTPNRDNWSSGDFDQRWDYGRRDEERDLPPDRGFQHGRAYGAYGSMRSWDRRSDGERHPSDYGWGQSGREWDHGRDFDDRGRRGRW
jgi:hypothetical protein